MVETYKFTDAHTPQDVEDIALCKKIYEILDKHYTGHQWCVGANSETGVADVKLLYTDSPYRKLGEWGYLLHLKNLNDSDIETKIRNVGGELLERYRLPRGPYRFGDKQRAIENGMDTSGGRM